MVLRCGARVSSGESSKFGADDSDACGCRVPFGGVIAVTLFASRLRVQTLDRVFGLDGSSLLHRHPLGGVVVKCRCPPIAFLRHDGILEKGR